MREEWVLRAGNSITVAARPTQRVSFISRLPYFFPAERNSFLQVGAQVKGSSERPSGLQMGSWEKKDGWLKAWGWPCFL